MRSAMRNSIQCLVLMIVCQASVAASQEVMGRVLNDVDGHEVPNALVELRDTSDRVIARQLSSANGRFRFQRTGASTYRVRVAAIGFAPLFSRVMSVNSGPQNPLEMRIVPRVIELAELVATGQRIGCRSVGDAQDNLPEVLEGARDALRVVEAAVNSRAVVFEASWVERRKVPGAQGFNKADSVPGRLSAWPLTSWDGDSLKLIGFARRIPNTPAGNYSYFGMDAEVMFSDWFLADHCLELSRQGEEHGDLRIRFIPRLTSSARLDVTSRADVQGEMVLDATDLAPRSLSYRYMNLPDNIPSGSAGGEVRFQRLKNGMWIPTEWRLWAPIPRGPNRLGRLEFVGEQSKSGRVLFVVPTGTHDTLRIEARR